MANKMINCKSCGHEIANNAKTCPNCGAKNVKPIYLRPWFIALAILLFIGIISSLGRGDSNSNSSSNQANNSSSSSEKQEVIYQVGDTITTKKFEVTINNVETKDYVGTTYIGQAPSEGGIYVCVDYTFKNISDKPVSSINFPSLKLRDSSGTKYENDFSATVYYRTEKDADRKSLSDLNPGITTSDNYAFEVAKELYENGEWYLTFDDIKIKIK